MKICGIELKGNDAIICSITGNRDQYDFILPEVKKIRLKDSLDQESIRAFSAEITAYLIENQFDKIGIKARATKGKFAGGSVSFKMEALIQNTPAQVFVINAATIKAKLKTSIDSIDFTKINAYQKEALLVSLFLMS